MACHDDLASPRSRFLPGDGAFSHTRRTALRAPAWIPPRNGGSNLLVKSPVGAVEINAGPGSNPPSRWRSSEPVIAGAP